MTDAPRTAPSSAEKDTPSPNDAADRRQHARVKIDAPVLIVRQDGAEEPCEIVNISAGGALLASKSPLHAPPKLGEPVTVKIEGVGEFLAKVVRTAPEGFAVDYRAPRAASAETADALMALLHRELNEEDRRDTPRIRYAAEAEVILSDGSRRACALLDISLTGASVEIDPKPELGAHLTVGRMRARVVRRHATGVGVVFTGPAQNLGSATEAAGADFAAPFGKRTTTP